MTPPDMTTREAAVAAVRDFLWRLPFLIFIEVIGPDDAGAAPSMALVLRRVHERVIGPNGDFVASLADGAERWALTLSDFETAPKGGAR